MPSRGKTDTDVFPGRGQVVVIQIVNNLRTRNEIRHELQHRILSRNLCWMFVAESVRGICVTPEGGMGRVILDSPRRLEAPAGSERVASVRS
jgi:hypothetical protein